MKHKLRTKKIIFIVTGLVLSVFGMVWIVDNGFNGIIKEWFYRKFDVDPNYDKTEKIGVIFKNWYEIKQFFIYVFILLIIIFLVGMSIGILYSKYRTRKEYSYISEMMYSFILSNSDELSLPKKYSEFEKQLMRVKSVTQKQQQLMEMETRQKNDLITYLAHDLKTPLASVIGYLSLLEEASDMPNEQKAKYTRVVLEKAYRLEELINEFFDITRFNLQSIILNKSNIKLAFMLQQLVDEFYPMLAPQGKQVVVQVPDDLTLLGDPDKLARVFNNVFKNAIAYSYENSMIHIEAFKYKEEVVIVFTNQGNEIPPQKLETIFEKFYRLDTARSTNTGGAGLGLAIAQEIMKAHNGSISATSNLESTIFTLRLPL